MVSVHLSDEEKLQVLLLALALFLLASLASVCLAASCCPLNRWLSERQAAKRRRRQNNLTLGQQQHQPDRLLVAPGGGRRIKASPLAPTYSGPPPAYEAALRASRLQSLTGALPLQPPSPLAEKDALHLGDYFHQPADSWAPGGHLVSPHVAVPLVPSDNARSGPPQAPLMLRLWVRMMEPGELVARARGPIAPESASSSRTSTLSRQLSIPHLFGSLVSLAGGKPTLSVSEERQAGAQGGAEQLSLPVGVACTGGEQPHSISSTSSSSGSSVAGANPAGPAAAGPPGAEPGEPRAAGKRRRRRSSGPPKSPALSAISSVTSRVLHMNVASFSYVKDEQLISTKRHNQLNYHHFTSSAAAAAAVDGSGPASSSKLCQLVISICDIENVLNSCWLNERSCALLPANSAIYVQCEILAAKSKSAQLLSYPLRALQVAGNQQAQQTHTVNFDTSPAVLPAAAELAYSSSSPDSSLFSSAGRNTNLHSLSSEISSSAATNERSSSGSSSAGNCRSTNWRHEPTADGKSIVLFSSVSKQIAQQQQLAAGCYQQTHTEGQQQQQHNHQRPLPDLIQFDSVFVSPILSKSTVQDGYLRFRVYSQCKYVNESCLAELKLPMRQLLQSSTRDNLGDYGSGSGASQSQPAAAGGATQTQADFILNNLLRNLVTASTGSPLSTLIEQISSEEREEAAERAAEQRQGADPAELQSSPLAGFGLTNFGWSRWAATTAKTADGLRRSSSSFNESLHRLAAGQLNLSLRPDEQTEESLRASELDDELLARQLEQQRRLEQNYCRSMLVSHWLNYLAVPSYECHLTQEVRGKLLLGLSYLPTSNRVIFNAHRASLSGQELGGKQMMKELRLQTSTCYLLRFMMVINGRVVKRLQTAAERRPEWDSQEPITFDLVNVSVEQPCFVVALVVRNQKALGATGSLQNLHQGGRQQATLLCSCRAASGARAHSEPESASKGAQHDGACAIYRAAELGLVEPMGGQPAHQHHQLHSSGRRDLVIGHLVLANDIWREMRAQPRKQIVRQFNMY